MADYYVTVTRVTSEGSTDIWRGKVGDGEDDNLVIEQGRSEDDRPTSVAGAVPIGGCLSDPVRFVIRVGALPTGEPVSTEQAMQPGS